MAIKGFYSFQNIIKHYFQSYFDRKQLKKKTTFFDQNHGLTPLEKYDFGDFERLHFLLPKKVFFSIYNIIKHYFQSYFDRNQLKKKTTFFDQKHGLTPLKKCDFWDFERLPFLGPKGFFSFWNIVKHYFQSYFDRKQLKKKNFIF